MTFSASIQRHKHIVMFQIWCLFLVASAACTTGSVHDVKYELLKDFVEQETDGHLAESLIDIIIDQGTTIKAMEKKMKTVLDQGSTVKALESKMNTLTETINQQGGQIVAMREQITDLEAKVHKQNQDIADLEHEKNVLNDTVIGQKIEIDTMETDLMKIIQKVHKEEEVNLMKDLKVQKGRANKHTIMRSTTIPNGVLAADIEENSKRKINTATTEISDRVFAKTNALNNMPNNKKGNVFNDKESSILGNGLERGQKRAVSHVAFSTYLTKDLTHLNIGRVIKMDQIFINDGNAYNHITGIFTVPTSGVYLLTYSIYDSNAHDLLEVKMVVDNKNMGTLKALTYATSASKTIITRLTAGEAVWLEIAYHSDASIRGSSINKFTTFSGVLLY